MPEREAPVPVDLDALRMWMDEAGLGGGSLLDIERLAGGTQNLMVRFRRGNDLFVLRHPPEHKRANSDETMRREARVLRALAGTDVPHPQLIAAEPSTEVLGSAFYLMEAIDGFNPTVGLPAPHRDDPAMRHAMGLAMADGAAALGRVDHEAVGLGDFGRPDRWLERQVDRWRDHLASYADMDGYPGPDIPGVEAVAEWLDANRPRSWSPGIAHGDYHLANVLFSRHAPDLAAIVDWELCTIGDPLIDLGWLLAMWPEPGLPGVTHVIEPWDGFPTRAQLVAHYGQQSERDTSSADWYGVLACYKLGIILEGTHARACAGRAPTDIGDLLHATTVGLFERAVAVMAAA